MEKVRILVADDKPDIAGYLKEILVYGGYEVFCVYSGMEALQYAWDSQPDLVLIDNKMPDLDGIDVVRSLRAGGSGVPIIVVTAERSTDLLVRCFEAGCDDFLSFPFQPNELLVRMRVRLRDKKRSQQVAYPSVLSFADVILDDQAQRAFRGDDELDLTPTEFRLLRFFLRNPQLILGRNVIRDHVWGPNKGSLNRVAVYVGYLRTKLEFGDRARLIYTVHGKGYILREANASWLGSNDGVNVKRIVAHPQNK